MFLKRFLVTFFVVAIFLVTSLPEQNICLAAMTLEGTFFEQGERLSSKQTVKMTLRIYDDEFDGNLLFEENQEVTIGSEKSLLTFEKGEITVQKRTSELATENMWVEVESNGQVMTPRLNLSEIGTVNELVGSSISLSDVSLRTAGESALIIDNTGVTLSASSSGAAISVTNANLGGEGVSGEASGFTGKGIYGLASGSRGKGVYGLAAGSEGQGVYGWASGPDGQGVYGKATGTSGIAVYGEASINACYGGYFSVASTR